MTGASSPRVAMEKAKPLVERGNALLQAGQPAAALAKFEAALKIMPGHPGILNNCAVVLERLGRLEPALEKYEAVRKLSPGHPGILNNCGIVLRKLDRPAEALERFDQALALRPDYAEALANRGKLLSEQLNRPAEALDSFDRALRLRPDHADALCNRGIALEKLDRLAEALASYERALSFKPDHPDGLYNRAAMLERLKRFDEAVPAWQHVLAATSDQPYVRGRLLHDRLQCCDWTDYETLRARIETGIARGEKQDEPWHLLVHCRSVALQSRCAEIVTEDRQPASNRPLWTGERYDHARIRIAWLSGGFGQTVETQTMADLLEGHDKERFEIFGVSVGRNDGSPLRARIEQAFEHFADARAWTDKDTARWIREHEIDILIILAPYMSDSRLGILRHRPAPLQVNFGFPGSVGADYLDFIIADRYTLPDADTAFYKEKAVRPAACVMGYYAPPAVDLDTPSRASLGLPEDGFVFCCFNNNYKIQPDTFDVWMRLLRDIEGSVLWLRDTNAVAKANLRQEAERRGVSPDRLVFASHAASYMGYIARFRAADLFLDAFPYNAHTTACEAVWAGLPLVTCVGETAVSRVASSILHAANLPELVTCDLASYEAQIRSLVAAPQRLIDIRETLARARSAGDLFNPKGFCRNLEAAFEIMHQRQQAGLPPDHIDGPLIF